MRRTGDHPGLVVANLLSVIRRAVPVALAAVLLAACGGSDDEPASTATPDTDAVAEEPAAEPAETTPAPTAEEPDTTEAPAAPAEEPAPEPAETEPPPAEEPAPEPAPDPAPEPTDPPVAVPAALQFSAPLVGGGEIEMGEFAGRPVLLWFWAPW